MHVTMVCIIAFLEQKVSRFICCLLLLAGRGKKYKSPPMNCHQTLKKNPVMLDTTVFGILVYLCYQDFAKKINNKLPQHQYATFHSYGRLCVCVQRERERERETYVQYSGRTHKWYRAWFILFQITILVSTLYFTLLDGSVAH